MSYKITDIECGAGWASLYQPLIDRCAVEGITIDRIKEKHGALHFYVSGGSAELADAIDTAQRRSLVVCELCGSHGQLRTQGVLKKTLCDAHSENQPPLQL